MENILLQHVYDTKSQPRFANKILGDDYCWYYVSQVDLWTEKNKKNKYKTITIISIQVFYVEETIENDKNICQYHKQMKLNF